MDKKHLRQTFRKKRVELSERERQERSAAICDTAIDFIDADWSTVHCFAPITRLKEVDTTAILRYAIHCPQLRLICSVSHFDSLEKAQQESGRRNLFHSLIGSHWHRTQARE